MAFYAYEPPDLEEDYINKSNEREQKYNAIKQTIQQKPQVGNNLEDIVNKWGNVLPKDIMVGSALMGFSSISPEVGLLLERYEELEKEKNSSFWEKTKAAGRGLVRNAFVGMDSLAEATVKRPFQASARSLIDNGMNVNLAYLHTLTNLVGLDKPIMEMTMGGEAYGNFRKDYETAKDELGPTTAGYAIQEMAKGNRVNLGRGYFGNSTLARDTDIYKELSQTISDPQQLSAIEKVIQGQLGFDITGTQREKLESNKYRGVTISPGRVAAVQMAEPGTDRFKFISGLIDGAVTLGLDPANLAGAWVGKLGKAGKAFSVGEKVSSGGNVGARTLIGQGNRLFQTVKVSDEAVTANVFKMSDAAQYKNVVGVDVGETILRGDITYTMDELNEIARANGRKGAQINNSRQYQEFLRANRYGEGYTRGVDDKFVHNIKFYDNAELRNGKFTEGLRTGTGGSFVDNAILNMTGNKMADLVNLNKVKNNKFALFLNRYGSDITFDEEVGRAVLKWVDADESHIKEFYKWFKSDHKWQAKQFDTMDELIDNTILHELAHTWVAKGKSPKQFALDKSIWNPLGKAARRRRRDKAFSKWNKDREPQSVMGLKSQWDLERDVEQMVTNFKNRHIADIEGAKNASGLQKFLKPSLNKTDFEEWHMTTGKAIYEFISDGVTNKSLDYESLRQLMPEASPSTLQDILENPNVGNVSESIAREVRTGGITKRLDPYSYAFKGSVSRNAGKLLGKAGRVAGDGNLVDLSDMGNFLGVSAVAKRTFKDTAIARIFGQVSPTFITSASHTQGLKEMEKLIKSLPFEKNIKQDLYKKLATTDAAILGQFAEQGTYSKLRQTEEFFKLLIGDGTPKNAGVLGELQKIMTSQGFPGPLAGGITKFIGEIDDARKYWVSLVGEHIVDVGFGTSKTSTKAADTAFDMIKTELDLEKLEGLARAGKADEISEFMITLGNQEIAQPTAMLMSEMLVGNIPLFDTNEVFRVLGTYRNSLLKISGLSTLTGLKRLDLPQLLGKQLDRNPVLSLAKTNDEFKKFLSNWELPVKAPSDKKVKQSYIRELQLKAKQEVIEQYEKISGTTLNAKSSDEIAELIDDETFEILNQLTTPTQINTALNVGNISSNAVTKNIAKLFYSQIATDEGVKLVNKAYIRWANNAMQQAWKPFTLLRLAWTTRVIAEEQLRMFAADMTNVWSHPVAHMSYVLKPDSNLVNNISKALDILPFPDDVRLGEKFVAGLKKGEVDILGRKMSEELLFKQAMSRGSNGIMMRKASSVDRFFKTIKRDSVTNSTKSRRQYAKGWLTEMTQLADDELMVVIANVLADNGKATRTPFRNLDELGDYLTGNFPAERLAVLDNTKSAQAAKKTFMEWTNSGDAITNTGRQMIRGDKDRTMELLQSYAARLYDKVGGGGGFKKYVQNPKLDPDKIPDLSTVSFEEALEKGYIVEINKGVVYKNPGANDGDLPIRMLYELVPGDKTFQYIEWIANRKLMINTKTRSFEMPLNGLNTESQFKTGTKILSDYAENGPDVVKVSKKMINDVDVKSYNGAIERAFDFFMSTPTNKLSRAPAFKQFYYRNLEKMADRFEADTLAELYKNKDIMEAMPKSTRQYLDQLVPKPKGTGVSVDELENIDDFLKATALSETEELLYSLNNRSQFTQANALLFPFAEVHLEIAKTWTRLLTENPRKLRKLQITTDTLKEGNPFNFDFLGGDAADDKPMVYTDELTNEEVFVYPLVDPILRNFFQNVQSRDLGGQQPRSEVNLRAVGFTSSANIVAGGLVPGVGPVAQIAAKAIMPNMKETSALYEFIFPFGEPSGNAVEQAADYLLPEWIQKLGSAISTSPQSWSRAYSNTQKEVLRAKLVSGAIEQGREPRTQDEMNKILQRTKQDALVMHLIKSAAQFTFVSPSFRWELEVEPGRSMHVDPKYLRDRGIDPEGRIFGFNVLQSVYGRLLGEYEDEVIATQVFTHLFGTDPTALIISKSKEIRRVPYTDEALDYAMDNEEKYKIYPDMFYYVRPDIGTDEFVMASWVNSFDDNYLGDYSARTDLDLGEWAQLHNQAAGRMALERYRRVITDPNSPQFVPDEAIREIMVTTYKDTLADYFPGYLEKPRTESPTDLGTKLKQLYQMSEDPDLQNEEVIKGLKIWLESYDNILTVRSTETGRPGSDPTNANWYLARDQLRLKGQEISKAYPLFSFLNEQVLDRILRENEEELIRYGYTYNQQLYKADQ